jgi:hypothetical protein
MYMWWSRHKTWDNALFVNCCVCVCAVLPCGFIKFPMCMCVTACKSHLGFVPTVARRFIEWTVVTV